MKRAFNKEKAFIGYLTAGDGGMDYCLDVALALIDGGVDLLEIGVPFSDPVADGPTIQAAMQRSLKNGTTLQSVLKLVSKIKANKDIPIVLMSYYNPIYNAGAKFIIDAKKCDVDGLLIVDLPIHEKEHRLDMEQIYIVSPSTTDKRIKEIGNLSSGFIYYACQKGTTGARLHLPDDFEENIKRIKANASLPVVAGFGIASKESALEAIKHADGFVVGSLFVDAMGKKTSAENIKKLAEQIDPRRTL